MAPKGKREKKIVNLQNLKNLVTSQETVEREQITNSVGLEEELIEIPQSSSTEHKEENKDEIDEDLLEAFGMLNKKSTSNNISIKTNSLLDEQIKNEEFKGYTAKVTIRSTHRGPVTRRNCTYETRRL